MIDEIRGYILKIPNAIKHNGLFWHLWQIVRIVMFEFWEIMKYVWCKIF